MKRRNINADSIKFIEESRTHTHQSRDILVSNHLDIAIGQLILHLHILISPFLQMNGDVLHSVTE